MSYFNLQKLNTGLSRVVSVKEYPVVRKQYVSKRTKGRVFRVGVLHGKELSENVLLRNRRGFINAQVNTVAHAPSLYHWLFHRCGIPFAETQEYVKTGGLKVDDVLVTKLGDLESQLDWDTFQKLDIQVRSPLPSLQRASSSTSGAGGKHDQNGEGVGGMWVPALKRALHRTYSFVYIQPGVSLSSDEAEPRSFVHRVAPTMGDFTASALGLNVLRPIGFMDSMKGFGVATNDVSTVRYWNNEFLGNYGVYDIRFARGVPSEVVHNAAADLEQALATGIRSQLASDTKVPCSCNVSRVPPVERDMVGKLHTSKALHGERIVVSTPLIPYRIVRKIRKAGGYITMTRSGPFVLSPLLQQQKIRALSPTELALFFTFERRLKTNRMIITLRDFDQQ